MINSCFQNQARILVLALPDPGATMFDYYLNEGFLTP